MRFSEVTSLLIEILNRTPPWVFVVFVALLVLGYFQSRDRSVKRGRVALLPVAMIVWSLFGVVSAFGMATSSLVLWTLGVAVAIGVGLKLAAPKGVTFFPEDNSFSVPGSWSPLILMMAIFFIKFGVGVVLARQLPVVDQPVFIGSIGFSFGFFSGLFLARALVVWRAAPFRHQKLT